MKNELTKSAERYHKAHKKKTIWYRIISVLSAITVFCTTYALILPAITMEDPSPGIKLDNFYVYEDSEVFINFHITGRATFEKEVLDKFGFQAQYFSTFKSLIGDSSDNIKGINGIGDKTAKKLIIENGDINKIIENSKNKGSS